MLRKLILMIMFIYLPFVFAQSVVINMYVAESGGKNVGTVTAKNTKYGLLLTPNLKHLIPPLISGAHGFHIHSNPSCADSGMAAGGHLDPKHKGYHFGPYNDTGHLGDLPVLWVNPDGTVTTPILAPRLKVKDIMGHSLMIHDGGDNYTESPPLGGGGSRMICGVISAH